MKNVYEDTLCFAAAKHKGQKRRDGKTNYISHPLAVSEILRQAGFDDRYVLTALLHDVLEDTDATTGELYEIVTGDIVHAVELLTRKKGVDENDYLQAVLSDDVAATVKSADKAYNLWECVRNGVPGEKMTDRDFRFASRYVRKTAKYYRGRLSRVVDDGILSAETALKNGVVLDRDGGAPVMEHASYVPYKKLQALNMQAALESYNKSAVQPDLDGADVKFYRVGSRLYLDEHASLGFLGKRGMWIMSSSGWRPIEVDLFPVYEDLDVIDREEVAEEIEILRSEGGIHDFVKGRLV